MKSEQIEARIKDKKHFPPRFYIFDLETPESFLSATPGQFVMARRSLDGTSPLLRKPLSIHDTFRDGDRCGIRLFICAVGPGTRALSEASTGEHFSILGPFGKGFPIPDNSRAAILLAGGMGVAPLVFLAERLKRANKRIILVYGTRTSSEQLCLDRFAELGVETHCVTEDGSSGLQGLATDLLPDLLGTPESVLYACGPIAMLKQAKAAAEAASLPSFFSLEEYMGCGFGVCLGCAVESSREPGTYLHACKDGPVFDPAEVIFR